MAPPASASTSAARQMGAVIRGCRTEFAGEGNPSARSQLVGVNTQPHAVPAPRLQDRPRLVCVEGALLAEDVAPAGRPGRGRDHGLRQQAQVATAVRGELGGHEVGARKVASGVRERAMRRWAASSLGGEPVAGLDLHGGGAQGEGLLREPAGPADELGRRGLPGGGHRVEDPSRAIGAACHAHGELVRPVAGEDQVGVGVDEPGHEAAASQVDAGVGVGGADPGAGVDDQALVDGHRRLSTTPRGPRPSSPSQVTSCPIPVTTSAVTDAGPGSPPSARGRRRERADGCRPRPPAVRPRRRHRHRRRRRRTLRWRRGRDQRRRYGVSPVGW